MSLPLAAPELPTLDDRIRRITLVAHNGARHTIGVQRRYLPGSKQVAECLVFAECSSEVRECLRKSVAERFSSLPCGTKRMLPPEELSSPGNLGATRAVYELLSSAKHRPLAVRFYYTMHDGDIIRVMEKKPAADGQEATEQEIEFLVTGLEKLGSVD